MKLLSSLFITFCAFNYYSQTSCFSSKDDVMTYVIGKSFESSDGKVKLTFNTSQATLKAGSSTFNYLYDKFSYIGSGYKGVIEMTELSGEGGLKMYVSCKERMMTDNKGALLYEEETGGNSFSKSEKKIPSIQLGNTVKVDPTYKTQGLEVMEGYLEPMTWSEAMRLNNVVNGWRLPDEEELLAICNAGDLDKNCFQCKSYWTSSKDKTIDFSNEDWAYIIGAGNCGAFSNRGSEVYYVKLIKPFGDKVKQEIENNKIFKIGKLVFCDITDLDKDGSVASYTDAEKFVSSFGKEWRLPNTSELTLMKENISLFNFEKYDNILGSARNYESTNKMTCFEVLRIKDEVEIDKYGIPSCDYNCSVIGSKIVAVRDLTSNEIIETEAIAKKEKQKEKSEEKAKQAEIASKMKTQGEIDSKINYKGKKSGAAWTTVTTLLFSPIVGVIPAAVCASKEPSDKNLNYPDTELMKDSNYEKAYKEKAHKTKKKKVWVSYIGSSAAWIIIILLL